MEKSLMLTVVAWNDLFWVALKGNSGQNFFFKTLHSSYRALKCQKKPFLFHLNYFFRSEVIEVLRYISFPDIVT